VKRAPIKINAVDLAASMITKGFLEYRNGELWRVKASDERRRGRIPCRAESKRRTGYLKVEVSIDGARYIAHSHRVIWVYFRGPIPARREINHINGKKDDNRIENLELVTRRRNLAHAKTKLGKKLGRPFGSKNLKYKTKITAEQAEEIRRLLAKGGLTQHEIADLYGIGQSTVSLIKRGKHKSFPSTQI